MNLLQNNQAKIFFYLLMAAVGFATYRLFQPYLGTVFFALIIVITFRSVYERIEGRLKRFKWLATPITILVVVLTILIPITILALLAINEISWIITDIIEFEVLSSSNIDEVITGINEVIVSVGLPETYMLSLEGITTWVQTNIGSWATSAQSYLSGIGGNAASLITNAIVLFSLLGTLFPSIDWLLDYLKELSPLSDDLDQTYIDRMIGMSRDMFRGIVVIAIVQGVATGVMFWALAVPYVVLWSVLATFLSLIPIGTALIFIPASAIFFLLGWNLEAIVTLLVGLVVIGNLDTILRPRLVSDDATVDSTLILIGALGGLALFGLMGVVYGPVLVIIFLTTLDIYRVHYSPTAAGLIQSMTANAIEQNDDNLVEVESIKTEVKSDK